MNTTTVTKLSSLRHAIMHALASGFDEVGDVEGSFLGFSIVATRTDLAIAQMAARSPRADGAEIFLALHRAADRLELAGRLARRPRPSIFAETVEHLRVAADVANAGEDDGFAAFAQSARLAAGFLDVMSAELDADGTVAAAE